MAQRLQEFPAPLSGRKLTQAQAAEVHRRRQAGETCRKLATEFGVGHNSIWLIGERLTYDK